jgi:hypothetical protein
MKYEVVQSPEVHEPMGRDYAGMSIYSQAFSVDLRTLIAWSSSPADVSEHRLYRPHNSEQYELQPTTEKSRPLIGQTFFKWLFLQPR